VLSNIGIKIQSFFIIFPTSEGVTIVKLGSIDNHSPMRGHMGHPEASRGDLENQPVL
jgi:hypothetical protein